MSSPALPPAPDFAAWMTSPSPALPAGMTSCSPTRTSSATVMRKRSPGLFLLDEMSSSSRTVTGVSAGTVTSATLSCGMAAAGIIATSSAMGLANMQRSIGAPAPQLIHGAVDSVDRERKHPPAGELARDADGRSPLPAIFRLGIQPHQPRKV